jgi:hypothetical protein
MSVASVVRPARGKRTLLALSTGQAVEILVVEVVEVLEVLEVLETLEVAVVDFKPTMNSVSVTSSTTPGSQWCR